MLPNTLLVSYNDYFKDESGKHYDYPDLWTAFAKDALSTVFLWAALALVVLLLGIGIFLYVRKSERFKGYLRTAITLAVGFSVAVIIAMLALEFYEMAEDGVVFELVLYPSVVLGAVTVLGIGAIYIASTCSQKTKKTVIAVTLALFACALVALLVCLGVYLGSGNAEENNGITISLWENVALYVIALMLIAIIIALAFFFDTGNGKFDSKSISYAAVCIAMSFALSYLKLWRMPQGGSVTAASLLPLMLYSYMFGTKKGVFAGFAYGVLQAVQSPWIVHPAQFLLDYPVAFAGIGISGMFSESKVLEKLPQLQFAFGALAASVLRFTSHVLSGVFAFSEYSLLDNVWVYSLGYNAYVFVDIAIVIAVGAVVFSSKALVREARKFHKKNLSEE